MRDISRRTSGYEDDLPLQYASWKSKVIETKFESGLRWLHVDKEGSRSVQWTVSSNTGTFEERNHPNRRFSEGTAHLLEHSIFLRMTPEEKTLFNYWNAYTGNRQTAYTFESSHDNTPKAIDIVFRNLFEFTENPQSLDEVKAVHSE